MSEAACLKGEFCLRTRIYLDNCCFNRPYDDQSSLVVYLESEAKLYVQRNIVQRTYDLVWSYVLEYENLLNPYEERQKAIAEWRSLATISVVPSDNIRTLANTLALKGLKAKDALHVACAIGANSDYFLTTDKRILNKDIEKIALINPLDFVRKMEEE